MQAGVCVAPLGLAIMVILDPPLRPCGFAAWPPGWATFRSRLTALGNIYRAKPSCPENIVIVPLWPANQAIRELAGNEQVRETETIVSDTPNQLGLAAKQDRLELVQPG